MSVVIETTLGDITVDLFLYDRPRACLNFLKLCKIKYYNYNLFHTISRGFIAQTGDPTGSRTGGESIYGILDGPLKRYFEAETEPRVKHTKLGLISFVGNEDHMLGSQFFFTLGEDITYLDGKHCVFGEVVEGFDVLEVINEAICDNDDRPYQDIRITHTVVLDDPYPDPKKLFVPSRSPSPTAERLQGGRIAPDEEIDETAGKSLKEINEMQAEREAKARATILEMVGDIPDADIAPPENVLFVCKLNPITTDYDLDVIFSRFGKIKSCEVIRDKKTNDSLQYAFVEFEDQKSCEDAYFKMDNVLIDDRRIHVDFSQSVSKVKWNGKGRGVTYFDDKGRKTSKGGDIGKGNYKYRDRERSRNEKELPRRNNNKHRDRSRSPEQKYKRDDRFRSSHQNYDNNNKYRDRSRSPRRSRDRSRSPNRKKEDYRSYSRRTTDLSSKKTDWNYRERDSYKERQRKYEKSSREKDESRERERYRTVKCSKSPPSNSNSKDDNERNRKKVIKHRDISDDDNDKKVMKKKKSKMKEESSEDDSSTDNSSGNESRRKKHKKKKSKSKSNDKRKKKKKRKQNSSSDSE